MSEKLFKIISKVMNVNYENITDESNPSTIPSWTSFIDEAMDVKNIADIKRHLKNHGVNLND